MIQRTLKQVSSMISIQNDISAFESVSIQGVSIDSRKIEEGHLFVPFNGEKVDGHQFVQKAIEDGASASLWEKSAGEPPTGLPILVVESSLAALQQLARSYREELNIKVVGITGSNGKTTTKDITTSLLSLQYKVQKTEGNYNSHIGLPLTILHLEEDTEVAVLEMGMSGRGEIEELTHIATPDAAIITNIGESHLQDLGSREGITEAKLEIVAGLKDQGLLVYLGDEPLLTDRVPGAIRVETFGKGKQNTMFPTMLKAEGLGTYFQTNVTNEITFFLPLLGHHNVMNAVAGMLVARELGVPLSQAQPALDTVKLTGMRLETLEGVHGTTLINDAYNASPTSTSAAISLLASLNGYNKKILVLGDMLELGEEEEAFHYEIGKKIPFDEVNYVFTYGKLAEKIAEGAKENASAEKVFAFQDKDKLTEKLLSLIEVNDVILAKASRGMKLEDVVDKVKK
ncbi:UDP-N-acetylmuramoyl-tripeptide--D-alanyl-D-alanine ligase [Bacillus sp. 2205SS5-2]|uniref:UDP-N-acetylmuramoyl-tripeptide--D-alanyl-D- alanine ligase n=1 Tax=Bacillus sp. 2205SS5-2 TaxID=3109031 RepID=UPI0030046B6F